MEIHFTPYIKTYFLKRKKNNINSDAILLINNKFIFNSTSKTFFLNKIYVQLIYIYIYIDIYIYIYIYINYDLTILLQFIGDF